MFSSLPSMYSIHAADAAVLALCPFARSLQMAYCAAIGDSPLLTVLCVAPGANREPEDGDDATQGSTRDLRNRSGGSEQSRLTGWLWLGCNARAADATAIAETLPPPPLQMSAIRAASIGRPAAAARPGTREGRDGYSSNFTSRRYRHREFCLLEGNYSVP